MAGDLHVGVLSDPAVAYAAPGSVPMRVLRAIPASVTADKR